MNRTRENDRVSDRDRMLELIAGIVGRAPRRPPASEGELVAQQMIEDEFKRLGLQTSWHGFSFHRSIFADLALHCGMAIAGTVVAMFLPWLGAALHAFAAFSYTMQSTRRHAVIRRLYRRRGSQNLLGVMPASDGVKPRLRLVFLGHADASYYGLVFSKQVVKNTMHAPWPLNRAVALAVWMMAALVPVDLLRYVLDQHLAVVTIVQWVMTLPAAFGFLLNMDVFLRNVQVPGANDNLTGSVALPVLAERLRHAKPDDVELVFAMTGCEEAGLGGAINMARQFRDKWDPENTLFMCMDGMSNGQLRYVGAEGEMFWLRPDPSLVRIVRDIAASRPDYGPWRDVSPFDITIGGTDMAAFQALGYRGISFVCIDPETGGPRFYHTPDDTPANLDNDALNDSVDFVEQLALKIINGGSST